MRPERFPPYFIFAMMLFCLILLLLLFEGMGSAQKEKGEHMRSYDPLLISTAPKAPLFLKHDTQGVDRHTL